jgi:hypothetical protein
MKHSRHAGGRVALGIAVLLLATGCTSASSPDATDVQREAAGFSASESDPMAEDPAPEVELADDAPSETATSEVLGSDGEVSGDLEELGSQEEIARGSLLRKVHVCVRNTRTGQVGGRTPHVNVEFDRPIESATWENDVLPPGAENCVTNPHDANALIAIMYTDAPLLYLRAENFALSAANIGITFVKFNPVYCMFVNTEGESKTYDDGFARYVITREADTPSLKRFTMTIGDSLGKTKCPRDA